ncbi:thermonuclease family protein [Rhizobium sp.]|uniref:thermonuclease family protein n=1 Tax=Rhizobium sp. TaxID=391 RepID=UPI00289F592A
MRSAILSLCYILFTFASAAVSSEIAGQARVIDGDTFSIRKTRIRIAAIDACERDQTGVKRGQIWPCGIEARRSLAKMIDGRHVRCVQIDTDQYRRLVGQCFIEGDDIGLRMVKLGQAVLLLRYLPATHPLDLNEYRLAEAEARRLRHGIWAARVEPPWLYRRKASRDASHDVWPN